MSLALIHICDGYSYNVDLHLLVVTTGYKRHVYRIHSFVTLYRHLMSVSSAGKWYSLGGQRPEDSRLVLPMALDPDSQNKRSSSLVPRCSHSTHKDRYRTSGYITYVLTNVAFSYTYLVFRYGY